MSHILSRSSRLALAVALVLALVTGLAPRAASLPDDPESVVPFVGSAELGCTRGSGGPVCGGHHPYDALDFMMPVGTPLVAPVDGFVTASSADCGNYPSGCGNGYGNWVQVSASDGSRNYLLAHMSEVYVLEGPVRAGDVVGLSGNSGASSAPHLHYEERTFGVDSLDGDQVMPGSMVACLDADFGWEYALGDGGWYDLPSHGGVVISSAGAECFDGGTRTDVFRRRSLEYAGVLPDGGPSAPADWGISATAWLDDRPVADAGNRPFDPAARMFLAGPQDAAMDLSTVWRIPPLR